MFLIIDTSEAKKILVALAKKNGLIIQIIAPTTARQSEKLLKTIDQLFKKAKIKLPRLKGIIAVKGPGSFVGLRVGLSVANALAYALKIPLAGLKKGEFKNMKDLIYQGCRQLNHKKFKIILPDYGKKLKLKIISNKMRAPS